MDKHIAPLSGALARVRAACSRCGRALGLAVLLGALVAGQGAGAQDRPLGLLWNRTGLPAVFPLIVKTRAGRDYYMVLIDEATDRAALAAYIRGGEFFRVLAPPGTFRLRFFHGIGWQGEQRLFGPGDETQVFDLAEPLTFRTRGISRKAGHIIDLRGVAGGGDVLASVGAVAICQGLYLKPDPDGFYLDLDKPAPGAEAEREAVRDLGPRRPSLRYDPYATQDYETRSYVCD
jgi:hypothetical protein